MTQELVSLTIIMAVAAASPIVAQLIPGKFIPQTVLLLAAGAVLGPYGFGVIEVNDAVKLLSELGMAFLFLLAGYEIDPKRLAGHQGKVGLLTWGITLGLAWLVVTFLPFFTKQGINGIATVIALTTTALGTLMPILKERNLEGTPIGDAIISYGTWGELGPILAMAILLPALLLIPLPAAFVCAPTLVNAVRFASDGTWRQLFGSVMLPSSTHDGKPVVANLSDLLLRVFGIGADGGAWRYVAVSILALIVLLAAVSLVLPFVLRVSRMMWIAVFAGLATALLSAAIAVAVDVDGPVSGSMLPGTTYAMMGLLACI